MSSSTRTVSFLLVNALDSEFAHAHVRRTVEAVEWHLAGQLPEGAPHSIFQIVNHLIFWQEFFLQRLAGEDVPAPEGDPWPWPVVPPDEHSWLDVRDRFLKGLDQAHEVARQDGLEEPLHMWPEKPRMEAVRIIASHNSYHAGQIVLLRRMLGAWPPQ